MTKVIINPILNVTHWGFLVISFDILDLNAIIYYRNKFRIYKDIGVNFEMGYKKITYQQLNGKRKFVKHKETELPKEYEMDFVL